jgi:hypothetical protein
VLFVEVSFRLEAIAIPKAAEIEVEEWPTPNVVNTHFLGKDIPQLSVSCENYLFFRSVFYARMLDAPRPKSINHRVLKHIAGNREFDHA